MRAKLLQIVPGAKALAAPGDDDDADRGVRRDPVELRLHRGDHRLRKRVEAIAAIERQRRDAVWLVSLRTNGCSAVSRGAFIAAVTRSRSPISPVRAARISGSCRWMSWAARRRSLSSAP